MKSTSMLASLGAGIASLASVASAQSWQSIPPIEAYGQHFFYSNNGSQFFLKGVAYQQDYSPNGNVEASSNYIDPLSNGDNCKRDIPYMQELFTNVIRVYALDPTADHDDCMEQFASAGIYVVADMSEPGTSIQSNDPSWNVELYARYTAVVDAMAKYNNVIGFFAGNEIVNTANQTGSAAYVKAAVRDTKAYIKSQGHRDTLGVGYATSDVPTRDELAHYFACDVEGGDSAQIDFWGYNVYSWCGDSTYQESGYSERTEFFSDYPVPVFFAEYGCNSDLPGGPTSRPFTEVAALFGPQMSKVFSGGIVYSWFYEENKYGLVEVDGDTVKPYPDFTSLKSQLAKVSPTSTMKSNYKATNTAPSCPDVGQTWLATATPLPPSVNPQFCECAMGSLECTITSDNAKKYQDNFDYICGENESFCAGFTHNSTTGKYGALSGCNPKEQLAWAANQLYLAADDDVKASACDFDGIAKTQAATTSAGCSALLQEAGKNGQGTVASPTGQQGTAIESGGVASDTSDGAAMSLLAGNNALFFSFGKVMFVGYVALAIVSIVGIVVL